MATFAIDHAEQIELVASDRKATAKKHFDAIKKGEGARSTGSMRIGWHAYRLKKDGLFGILGFESEDDARKAAGVGQSTWYGQIRLAEQFYALTEEQYCSMKDTNAAALVDLPESKRFDSAWIRQAGVDSIKDFAAKIETEMDGKAKASDGKEKSVVLKMPMPASRKKAIDEGLETLTKQMGLDAGDPGKTLEIVIAERTGQMGLVEAITNAIQRIKGAKAQNDLGLSAEELLVSVFEIMDGMVLDFQAALDAVSNQAEEVA